MPDATICPLLLVASPEMPPNEVDRRFLCVVEEHLDECSRRDIHIHLSRQTLEACLGAFPWHGMGDARLRQRIALWRSAVLTPLRRHCILHSVPVPNTEESVPHQSCAVGTHTTISHAWSQWLTAWANGPRVNGKLVKGLATEERACNPGDTKTDCDEFTVVTSASDWLLVQFPWYHKYPRELPAEGPFVFCPPSGWESSAPQRGESHGYVDVSGNEWRYDRFHRDHWDVQLQGKNTYRRISADGRDIDEK